MIDSLAFLNADNEHRAKAMIRAQPGDFGVHEIPLITPCGDGEHLFIEITKTGLNTQDVVKRLARVLAIKPRDIGFAGRKDRHAQSTQWFSAWMPGKPDPTDIDLGADIDVLSMIRHNKKLKRGQLKGNRFNIVLQEFSGDVDTLQVGLLASAQHGVPNYFGEQRFGYQFANLEKCLAFFAGDYQPRGRQERSMLISSARAFLFNQYVSLRLAEQTWDTVLAGDVLGLAGSQSIFVAAADDASLQPRYRDGDLHISGPLCGDGDSMASGKALQAELTIQERYPDYTSGLSGLRVKHARRPMRIIPKNLEVKALDKKTLQLDFSLPAGAYATAVLREYFDYSVARG